MVSTRQMTGATSEESSLQLCRTVPTTLTSNTTSNVATITSSMNTKAPTVFPQHTNQPLSPTASSGPSPSSSSISLANIGTGMTTGDQQVQQQQQQQQQRQETNLMDLPTEILEHIFSFVGYKKIAHMRVISRQMNKVCCSILNSTFQKLQNQMHTRFQTVKAKMPRRESARRNHPLACECDILETCYMRLSLLQMTFGKHIERKHCCFFPGGILDEVFSVLNYIRTSPSLDRPFKVTDELFDLSTMAMEYFKEHIEPNLPAYFTNSTKSFAPLEASSSILSRDTSHSNSSSPPQSNMVLRKGIRKIKQGMKRYNNQLTVLRSELRTCKRKATEQAKTITEQQKLLAEQQKQTLEFANRLDETDKKNDELSRKFSTVLQELNKCKTELQYWRSKSPATTNPHGQVVPAYELQTLGSPNVVSYDIDLLSIGIGRNASPATVEDSRKKDDPGHNKEKLEHSLQVLRPRDESPLLSESTEPLPVALAKPGLKRKLECVTSSPESSNSDCTAGNDPVRMDGLVCLNPPFASASLAASYSSSTLSPSAMYALSATSSVTDEGSTLLSSSAALNESSTENTSSTGLVYPSSTDASRDRNEIQCFTGTVHDDSSSGATGLPVAASKSIFNNTKAIHQSNTNHTLNQNSDSSNNISSSSFSNTVDSKNDSTSNDNNCNNHMKKIRRVQNKARSQSYNRQSNLNATVTTHTKTTRSKQLDKQAGN